MLILIDLDGTLLNSLSPEWEPFRNGEKCFSLSKNLNKLFFFDGAIEFIHEQQQKGNSVLIVSDSHPKFVEPISKYIGCNCVCLADKPNSCRLLSYIKSNSDYSEMLKNKNCVFIGDTVLDIELGRRLGIPTIWLLPYKITDDIKNEKNKVGDEMACIKMGPTYFVKSFKEIKEIFDNPINNLYVLESIFAEGESLKAIKYSLNRFRDGSYAVVRCLARQESGVCDKYARADKYYLISSPDRSKSLLLSIAKGISTFINQSVVLDQRWDCISYLTDKKTTTPVNKMKEIFEMIETSIPKIQLFKWSDSVCSSLRDKNNYSDRKEFLEKYLSIDINVREVSNIGNDEQFDINGKNIIILDDQLTTSATAWFVIHELKAKGARNILFIALFQMVFPVESNVLCPKCGKPMSVKIRRQDGYKFYSCVPPKYGGNGCGCIIDFPTEKVPS